MRFAVVRASAALVTVLSAVAACTPGGAPSATSPPTTDSGTGTAVTDVDCPPAIVGVVVGSVRCQLVRVPVVRDHAVGSATSPATTPGAAGTVQIHVTRIRPPGGGSADPAILVAGTNMGSTPNYLGISPLAQRAGREVVVVDARGTANSRPSIDCPEAHSAADAGLSEDSAAAARVLDEAVARCAARLSAEGVDVTRFGVLEQAADLREVRAALGLGQVDLVAYGSASRVVAEMLRTGTDGIRSVVLDSPTLPGEGFRDAAAGVLTRTVADLLEGCRLDHECRKRHLARGEDLTGAILALEQGPIVLDRGGPDGSQGAVALDQERLLRLLRQMTSDGGSSGTAFTVGAVPRLVGDVQRRDTESLSSWLLPVLATQEAFCLGRSPSCLAPRHHIAVGPWLTVACTTPLPTQQEPNIDPSAGLEVSAQLCRRWQAGGAPTDEAAAWDVPTLVVVGRYGTYAPPAAVLAGVRELSRVQVLEDPAAGSSVMARTECMLGLRDHWLDDPGRPLDTGCLSGLRVGWE